MTLALDYPSGAALSAALAELRKNQGLLVAVSERPLDPGQPIAIELTTPCGTIELEGQVIQALAGHGLAIRFNGDDARLAALCKGAARGDNPQPPTARWADEDPKPPDASPRSTDIPIRERLKTATKAEKIQLALHGGRPERNLLIRDRDKSIHQYVIRNPKLGIDEVAAIARMGTVAPDVLAHIAGKREWFQRPDVASAMIRNPKVSAVVAKRMLNFVSSKELRQLAKGNGVREAVAQEARRRLFRK